MDNEQERKVQRLTCSFLKLTVQLAREIDPADIFDVVIKTATHLKESFDHAVEAEPKDAVLLRLYRELGGDDEMQAL